MNFWKTLLGSVMVLAAFTACSDDDTDDGGYKGIPEITVDGGTSTTIAGSLAGGKLEQTVEVVSKGAWELSFENESDATWCTPSPMNGKTGTTQISFTLGQATAERQATLTLTAMGLVEGIPVTKTATIIVKQNEGGTTEVTTNVKAVRDQLTFEQTGKEITESLVLTGIVVSDYVGNNINNHQIMVTDNTTEPGAGLMIRFKGYVGNSGTDYNLTRGSIVSFDLKGGTAQSYYGTYQVQFTNADPEIEILDKNDNTPEAIEVSDPSKLIDYQSQYVKVYSQPVESIRGEMYYNVSSGYANQTFQTKDGSTFLLSFNSYSKDWASTIAIPAKAGYIKGCVSLNNNAGNISPRNADDLAGMTDDPFTVETPEPEKTTISQITAAGQYEIEAATVVATYTGGFVMSDETASILVFLGYGAENIPAVGDVVSVSGGVTSYGDAFQFAEGATVSKTGTATVEYPNPTEITESNIGGLMEKPVVTYVKMTGTLSVSGNYYNIEFPFETSYTGSISGPNADLNAGSYDGQMVTVEGYFVNNGSKNGGGRYFTVVATKLTPDSSTPIVTFTTQPATFAATSPEAQTLNYTAANLGSSEVTFTLTGANTDKFTVVKYDDKSVTVNALGDNTTDAAYTATLAAQVDGKTLASVELKQNGVGGSTTGGFESMASFISNGGQYDNPCGLGDGATANGEPASGFKVGTGSKSGVFESAAVGVTGDKTLGFYAVAWKGKKATLYIKVNNGGTINGTSTFELNADDGATGNPAFTLKEIGEDDYYTVSISGLTAESTISFSTSENFAIEGNTNGRAIVCGVQLF
ncbi:DUF5689 domain-containing protein [Alistipes sp.]|uniref:DUF5689 domain-containing protein n=1 Tax=Alistipes sp. TaxID=1872444 RepID=UPI0025C447C3|nr:DUF5689 domain-containing protein [Alistipes sp.]MCI7139962.1 hypothetical protein [Alistipes sp.]MDY5396797.1 hypothetical protein [Alistipes sp.]